MLKNSFIIFMIMNLPIHCPSCLLELNVTQLSCLNCHTEVIGVYKLPVYNQLDVEEQAFIIQFLLSSGSLKEMAIQLTKSYPTVRNKLDDLIAKVKKMKNEHDLL